MKKFLVWLICLILLTQPVLAQSEKLIILNTNTGQRIQTQTLARTLEQESRIHRIQQKIQIM